MSGDELVHDGAERKIVFGRFSSNAGRTPVVVQRTMTSRLVVAVFVLGSQTPITQKGLNGEAARQGRGSHQRRACGRFAVTNADNRFYVL